MIQYGSFGMSRKPALGFDFAALAANASALGPLVGCVVSCGGVGSLTGSGRGAVKREHERNNGG